MNRRNFNIKALLGLVGVSLIPTSLLFSKNTNCLVTIGLPNEHVRHGMLNNKYFFPIHQLKINIKRDIFFKNGMNKCPKNTDLISTTIEYKGNTLTFFNNSKSIIKGGLRVESYKIRNRKTKIVDYNKALVITLSGEISIGGNPIPNDKGVIINSPTPISGNGEYMVINLLD